MRVLEHRVDGFPVAVLEDTIEAALTAGMAGALTDLLDHQDDDIAVAVQAHLVQMLHLPGFLTLSPQLALRTSPIICAALGRTEARHIGKECVSTGSCRWLTYL